MDTTGVESVSVIPKLRGWPKGKPRKQRMNKHEPHLVLQNAADSLKELSEVLLGLSVKALEWDAAAESLRKYLK